MQIRSGKTRIVLLLGDSAIKIGMIRPIRLFFRALAFPFMSEGNHNRFYSRYGSPFFCGAWNYFIAGLHANRGEFEYYQKHGDTRVVPTLRQYLGGWIIIQKRGNDVSAQELMMENPFKGLPIDANFLEQNQHWQFCRVGNQLLLADYGRRETREALLQTLQ